jgi:hypothetical protein
VLETLKIPDIITGHTQFRAVENPATVAEYADAMQAGEVFPPIVVWRVGDELHLSDGYHRLAALRKLGRATVEADVREGTALELFEHALGANARHGLPRTQEDKRKAVRAALAHDELSRRSDTQISKLCGVSQPFVSKLRQTLSGVSVVPKKADEIQHILDLPLLEQWDRVLPNDDKRKESVRRQLRLIRGVLLEPHTPPRWGLTVAAFPRREALSTAWVMKRDGVERDPAVIRLWLLWLNDHPEPVMRAEEWSRAIEEATDYAQCWKLAAQSSFLSMTRIRALRAGVQLLWIHEVWDPDALTKLEPETAGVEAAVTERLIKITPAPSRHNDGPPEPKIAELNAEQWFGRAKRQQNTGDLYSARKDMLRRAIELELPMRRCLACTEETVEEFDMCLCCYRGLKEFSGIFRKQLENVLIVAHRMNGPLWAALRYLNFTTRGPVDGEHELTGFELLAVFKDGIPDLDRAWDEVFVPEDKGLDDAATDDGAEAA